MFQLVVQTAEGSVEALPLRIGVQSSSPSRMYHDFYSTRYADDTCYIFCDKSCRSDRMIFSGIVDMVHAGASSRK